MSDIYDEFKCFFIEGEEALEYTGPMPCYNSGCHRYTFLLFKQRAVFSASDISEIRSYFAGNSRITKTCSWAASKGMGTPVAAFTFRAQWSPAVDEFHCAAGFIPPEEFQSPSQKAAVATAAAAAADAARAFEQAQIDDPPPIPGAAAGTSANAFVFNGLFVNKKYGNEMLHRSRFCWIDAETKRFFWSKTEGKDDPKKKSLSLSSDIAPNGISISKNRIVMLHHSGKVEENIHLEISGTSDDVAAAEEWFRALTSCSN